MKRLLYLSLSILLLVACEKTSKEQTSSPPEVSKEKETETYVGTVSRTDSTINELIKSDAKIEVLVGGFQWTEGPIWIEDGGYVLFSEIPSNSIMKYQDGKVTTFLKPSGYTGEKERGGEPGSNGLILDQMGNLVMCQHGDRRLARLISDWEDPQPNFETIVGTYEGKRFNSPNDAVYDSQGNLYFTDPPYGLEGNMNDPTKEIDFQGVYRLSSEGELSLISNRMSRPNGIGLSPDEKTLYVANSDPKAANWMAFDLDESGSASNGKIFYDATGSEGKGLPDGLKVDKKGNIWATGPGGVFVFSPDAKVLGKIETGEATSNCAFNTDFSTLYMTCDDYLMKIDL